MKSHHTRASIALASSLAALLALSACNKADDRTAGQKLDSAVAKSGEMASEAKQDVKDAAAKAEAKMKEAAEQAKTQGAPAMTALGEKIEDATITGAVKASLATEKDLSAIKINVDTKDGVVTLIGPAPTLAARERASEIARNVKGVNSVNNQLIVSAS